MALATWTSYNVSVQSFTTSDSASFAQGTSLYLVGGYNLVYEAQNTLWKLDTTKADPLGGVYTIPSDAIEVLAPMAERRGDLSSTTLVNDDGSVSFLVGGGLTQANLFCDPLTTLESYNLRTGVWSSNALPSLGLGRADGFLGVLGNDGRQLVAMGGLRLAEDKCSFVVLGPQDLILPVVPVEILSPNNSNWTVVGDLPRFRFSFAAATFPDEQKILTFGGHQLFDFACQCLRSSRDIVEYTFAVESPTSMPTADPTQSPITLPTADPTQSPITPSTAVPSQLPGSSAPTQRPTFAPVNPPSISADPTIAPLPVISPTAIPTSSQTRLPTSEPADGLESAAPSSIPSAKPIEIQSQSPSLKPSDVRSDSPSMVPSILSSTAPSVRPQDSSDAKLGRVNIVMLLGFWTVLLAW